MPSERLADLLRLHRDEVRQMAARRRASNPRVFGSTARGEDHPGSDIDILVDPLPGATLLDLGGLQAELEELLGVRVDLVTPGELPATFRQNVLREALPI